MKRITLGSLMLAFGLLPTLASGALVLKGKTTSAITARVVHSNKLTVTDDKGGWFGQGLEMQQLGGWNTPYEVDARLRVVSTSGVFQVRMDEPLQIRNQANPSLVFREPTVALGAEGQTRKLLKIGQSTEFHNPPPIPREDSIGFYSLAISAYVPTGDFKDLTGTYSGVLSLTFEPVAKAL